MNARKLIALAALALAGCSLIFDPSKVDEPPQREEVVTWVEAWLDAYLPAWASCNAMSVEQMETFDMGTRAAYRDRVLEFWGNGKRTFDRVAAAECLALVQAPTSCDDLVYARFPDPTHPCQVAMQGTAGRGEACASTLECSPELFCDGGNGICPGTCAPRAGPGSPCGSPFTGSPNCRRDLQCNGTTCISRHVGAGQSCTSGLSPCSFGLYCDSTSTHCEPMVAVNGDCSAGQQCAPGLYCDGAICLTRVAAGGACTVNAYQCALGHRCGPALTCVPYSTVGGACGPIDAGESQDCVGSRCSGTTCAAIPAKGQAMGVGGCAPAGLGVGAPATGAICADICP